MTTALQYKLISEKILETVELPAGTFYPDLSQINARLSSRLNLNNFEIEIENAEWQLEEEMKFLSNDDLTHLSFSMLPINGNFHWIMSLDEVSKITAWAMTKDKNSKAFSSEILQEGFYYYLILEAMDAIDHDDLLNGLSLKILPEATAIQSPSLCLDVRIIYQNRSARSKLIIPKEMASSWKQRFFKNENYLLSKTALSADFFLSLKVGSVNLSYEMLDKIEVGDCVVLDHSYYDPKTHQGNVVLTFNQTPLYQAKLTQNELKILNFSEANEDNMEDFEETTAVENVPLSIQIEMGKIKMSLSKLLSLKTGEVIETTLNSDDKISLVLNNKTIAKGELVKVGKTVGVRILELN